VNTLPPCPDCKNPIDTIGAAKGGAFTLLLCPSCGREAVLDSHGQLHMAPANREAR
jgi:hypothetical protein